MRAQLVDRWPRQLATAAAVLLILASVASGRLLHVGLVFRHGHRSPIHLLPNDSHTVANTWHDGLGQLTNLGKRNHFELGTFLRRRYGEFLGTRYNSSEHRIRSSNVDRTLMSAQACLAALFPPVDDQAWQSGLAWQPIPVHTVAIDRDPLLQPTKFDACSSRFAELADVARRSPERRRVLADSADFLSRLSVAAGVGSRPFTFDTVYKVTDTLMVLRAANLTLPAWASAGDTYQRLQSLGRFGWRQFSWSPELRQLQVGVLLDDLLTRLEAAAAGRLPSDGGRRLTVYSGHDVTLTPLLAALGDADFVWPNYAACVLFELHAPPPGADGQPLVRIFYRNDTRLPEPLPLSVPGCDPGGCPLSRLAHLLAGCRISAARFRELCRGGRPAMPPLVRRDALVVAASGALGGAAVALLAAALLYLACLRPRMQGGQDRPSVAYHSLLGAVEN